MATGILTEMAGKALTRGWTTSELWLYYISTQFGERLVMPKCNAKHIWAESLSEAVLLAGENRPLTNICRFTSGFIPPPSWHSRRSIKI